MLLFFIGCYLATGIVMAIKSYGMVIDRGLNPQPLPMLCVGVVLACFWPAFIVFGLLTDKG
jgi:hypothetical protein